MPAGSGPVATGEAGSGRDGTGLEEFFRPTNAAGHLHDDKEGKDGTDGDREPGKSFEEKCIREENEVDQLRESGVNKCESQINGKAKIADHKSDGNGGRNRERPVDRNVVSQISQEKMESEERRGKEKVVHRMQID